MTSRQRLTRTGLVIFLAAAFVVWHLPLLTPHGRIRGFDTDAAIIGLMGKKMFDLRGFDFFFWGQNYVGPLTSMLTAAWAFVTGAADPLALRLAVFTEMLVGSLLTWWAVDRVDRRAAIVTLAALAITPPVLLWMMVTPLGAEMGFFMSTILFAVVMQHVTAPPGRGLLARPAGQVGFGILAGLSWWMNQQVVFTLGAAAVVLGLRSKIVRGALGRIRPRDRFLLHGETLGWRRMPGVVEALVWLSTRAGAMLLLAFVLLDLRGGPLLPFLFGPLADPLLLILVPHLLLPLFLGEIGRIGPLTERAREEIAAFLRFAVGCAIGYLPVWLGGLLDWYPKSYVVAFRLNYPSEVLPQARRLVTLAGHWIGMTEGIVGLAFGVALFALAIAAVVRKPSEARWLLAIVPLLNVVYFLVGHGATKQHYLIASVGMLFGLAALGAIDLWDSRRSTLRAAVVLAGVVATLSMTQAATAMHRYVTEAPDPMPLLERVRAAECAVCYADLWIAYRYRFLDQEQRAWIVYRSQNRTRSESFEMQKRPGQRCLVEKDGTVVKLAGDLQFVHAPPRGR
jgi:hypothetical protein